MKQLIPHSSFAKISRGLAMGLASCAFLGQLAYAQKPTVVSTTTDKGITTTTYSDGKVVKSLAEGYQFDSLFYKPGNVVQPASPKFFTITARLGWANDLQLLSTNMNFGLGFGQYGNITGNYYFTSLGKASLGLGATFGFQNFFISDETPIDGAAMTAASIKGGVTGLKTINRAGQKDFMYLIGPAAIFPVSSKLNLAVDAKIGLIFSVAPSFTYISGAYINNVGQPFVYSLSPGNKALPWGASIGGDLLYKLNPSWSVGLNIQGNLSQTPYVTIKPVTPSAQVYAEHEQRRHVTLNIGVAAAYTLPATKPVYAQLAPPPAPPVVTPPVLNQGAKMFDYGSTEVPTFSWKSTSPSAKNEEFIFKLYKADGSGVPIYQQTTKANSVSLPKSTSLVNGDEGSFYYYTVQSSIGKYLSEPTAGSFGYKAKPVVPEQKATQDQYIVKIFNGKPAPAATSVKRKPTRKAASTAVTGSGTSGKPKALVPRKKKPSGAKPVSTKAPLVNYENVSTDPSVKWPSDLPLPQKPAIYEYEVQRLSAGDCKPTGQVAKYKFYIDPKKPNDIRIIPDSPKK